MYVYAGKYIIYIKKYNIMYKKQCFFSYLILFIILLICYSVVE